MNSRTLSELIENIFKRVTLFDDKDMDEARREYFDIIYGYCKKVSDKKCSIQFQLKDAQCLECAKPYSTILKNTELSALKVLDDAYIYYFKQCEAIKKMFEVDETNQIKLQKPTFKILELLQCDWSHYYTKIDYNLEKIWQSLNKESDNMFIFLQNE